MRIRFALRRKFARGSDCPCFPGSISGNAPGTVMTNYCGTRAMDDHGGELDSAPRRDAQKFKKRRGLIARDTSFAPRSLFAPKWKSVNYSE